MIDVGITIHHTQVSWSVNIPLENVPGAAVTPIEDECNAMLVMPSYPDGSDRNALCTLPLGHTGSHVSHGMFTATSWVRPIRRSGVSRW